jgi:hypothetical protein
MLILNHTLDIGALGYAKGGTAVLRISDLAEDLTQFSSTAGDRMLLSHRQEATNALQQLRPYV